MKIHINIYLNQLFFFLILSIPRAFAHSEPELHQLCKKTKDYIGCLTSQSYQPSLQSNSIEWRNYGPLNVNWDNWRRKNNSYVTPTLNKQGQTMFLAINCSKNIINITGINNSGKGWQPANLKFENKLVTDFCKSQF